MIGADRLGAVDPGHPAAEGDGSQHEVGTPSRPARVIAAVVLAGLLITGAVTWTASTLNARNEDRLLQLQTQQAGEVLAAAIPSTQSALVTAAQIAGATNGNAQRFIGFLGPYVGAGRQFDSALLLEANGSGVQTIAVVGAAPSMAVASPAAHALVQRSLRSPTFAVTAVRSGLQSDLAFAYALPHSMQNFVVYAERPLPRDKRASVAANSAFADLRYAIFLGPTTKSQNLLATSFGQLPASGRVSRVSVPFGDTRLTMVTAPTGQLGGTLSERLPWTFGILGVLLTILAALFAGWLVRRRRTAERDAVQIRRLYGELGQLYREQRTIAETLQRSLLPQKSPDIPNLDIAVRYVPGAQGVDIGGDWYSIVTIDDRRFGFVIGDVSGRGIGAATVMASLRYTIRTLILEGNSPTAVLEKCARHLKLGPNGRFATALVGVGDLDLHEVALANAGHLNPLQIIGDSADFVQTKVGVPLGMSGGTYDSVTMSTPPKSTMIAFTDGLVERRGENLDVGLERLRQAASMNHSDLEGLLTMVVTNLTDDATEDDVAIVALRWLD